MIINVTGIGNSRRESSCRTGNDGAGSCCGTRNGSNTLQRSKSVQVAINVLLSIASGST